VEAVAVEAAAVAFLEKAKVEEKAVALMVTTLM